MIQRLKLFLKERLDLATTRFISNFSIFKQGIAYVTSHLPVIEVQLRLLCDSSAVRYMFVSRVVIKCIPVKPATQV